MASENLYAPPMARVSDIDATALTQPVRLWPPRGRMGRLRLLAYTAGAYLVMIVVIFVATLALGAATGGRNGSAPMLVMAIAYLGNVFVAALIFIQRSHDMDLSGWFSLLAIIPFVGLYWLIKRGSPGVNRFGPPPPPNSTGVKVLAWFFLLVPIGGIVAAITIPAYHDYTVRAKARAVQLP